MSNPQHQNPVPPAAVQPAPPPQPLPRPGIWPAEMQAAEELLLQTRRAQAVGGAAPVKSFGLALSGGGIRSATFCLGVLQGMARAGLLRTVDYLSTVSGGGYIGGFLGALIIRKGRVVEAEQALADHHSSEMNWLRENGRHLAPNGSGDLLAAFAVQLRNWLSVVVLMGVSVLAIFLAANWLRTFVAPSALWTWWQREWPEVADFFSLPCACEVWWWSPWSLAPLVPAAVAVALGWGYWLAVNPRLGWKGYLPLLTMTVFLTGCLFVGWAGEPTAPGLADLSLLQWVLHKSASVRNSLGAAGVVVKAVFWLGLAALAAHLALLLAANVEVWRRLKSAPATTPGAESTAYADNEVWRKVRSLYGGALKETLVVTGVALAFALLDSLGQSLYLGWHRGGGVVAAVKGMWAASGLATLLSLGDKLAQWVQAKLGGKGGKTSLRALATCGGIAGFGLFLLNFNLLAHALAWGFECPTAGRAMDAALLLAAGLAFLLIAELQGRHLPFLNGSSLQQVYGARLVRAYLGATNRLRQESKLQSVTNVVPGDDIWLHDYQPHNQGGPLHIINVTFNETCSGKSQLEQRDRKGLPLAVGPCGLSVGSVHHVRWKQDALTKTGTYVVLPQLGASDANQFQMFPSKAGSTRPLENLSIGHWLAISGAAFGTGLGHLNSLGYSLLTGLANLRLGYWWDSGVNPRSRTHQPTALSLGGRSGSFFSALFPVQSYLYCEWLSRFHGPARRHWYLSDGGHFENTGVYELLRRRVPYILCCDCGADPGYGFPDLANLVRKARIDFGAEVRFVSAERLKLVTAQINLPLPPNLLSQIGLSTEFLEGKDKGKQPHALLAVARFTRVQPGETEFALLLFLKPALSGDEPLDVWEYKAQRKDFPQESTADQFFDEAQWESYRELGEHSADAVLGRLPNQPLWFTKLEPALVWQSVT